MEFITRTDENVTHVNFAMHRVAKNLLRTGSLERPSPYADVIDFPVELTDNEPSSELTNILTFLEKVYPHDYDKIATHVDMLRDANTPWGKILDDVLLTLESDRPKVFTDISRLLTGETKLD